MSEPFIAEIKMFAGNFAPRNYMFCDGALLPISQNTALFSILGTTYGGDGISTFQLPDMRGRVPMHPGRGAGLTPRRLGDKSGTETVTLNEMELPPHNHQLLATSTAGDTSTPSNNSTLAPPPQGGRGATAKVFGDATNIVPMDTNGLHVSGGSQPHANEQPYQAINYIIAIYGLYPSRG